MADTSQVKEITAKLEQGVKDLFASDTYADYLKTMSRFYQYSTRNTLLIHMQMPGATHVAGFHAWQNKFGRRVVKGAKSIKIFAPTPFTIREEKKILDPNTRLPVLGENGMPVVEETERHLARFKVVSVFDISQTDGKPLPSLVQDLTGNVEQFTAFMDALADVSPLPIVFESLPNDIDGVCIFGDKISIRRGMSEIQTVSAAIHEITHAKLHDLTVMVENDENAKPKDRRTEEVEAESVSYAVCQYFGIETGANSFGYLAEWSRGRELKELNASLDTIRKTAAELIDAIDGKFREIAKDRDIVFAVGEAQTALAEPDIETEQRNAMPEAAESAAEQAPPPVKSYTVGTNVLMTPVFDYGNFNRTGKKIRVTVEEPAGKYQLFSREESGDKNLYFLTASGRIDRTGEYFVSEWDDVQHKHVNHRPTEAELDEAIAQAAELFEDALADPTRWAKYQHAAAVNRLDECEAHNVPVRMLREEEQERRQAESEQARMEEYNKRHEKYNARVDEIAKAIEKGQTINVGYLEFEYNGKNPMLDLFKLYDISLPLRTQGWINTGLAEITESGYRYYTSNHKRNSTVFSGYLAKLREAIKLTPIEQKRQPLVDKTESRERPVTNDDSQEKGASMEYSELQQKGFEIAKKYESFPLQDRLDIIAQSFGVKSASVYIEPCRGKYIGQSDIMLKLDGGGAMGIGMHSNANARKDSTISECVNNALAKYNPEIVAEAKARALTALKTRESEDNINAEQRGLKPYKFLNVELSEGNSSNGHTGWYYATIAVDNKVIGFVTSDLSSDIARGELTDSVSRANYFVAGGLKDADVDFVFNNVGHSSFNDSYTVEMGKAARERADNALAELSQTPSLVLDDKEFWSNEIAAFLASNDGKIELADLKLPPFRNHGGLDEFMQVFDELGYEREFARIVAEENAKRTGEPWIVVNFCEGGEYRPYFLKTPTAMLFSEADSFIKGYEPKIREMHDGGYDKLDYNIFYMNNDSEFWVSNERYDIGDGKKVSGFYNVLKAETDYYYSHPEIFKWKTTDENFAVNKERAYGDIEIFKKAVTTEYPYVEIEKVVRYADGDRLDERVFNKNEVLTFAEADSKIKSEEKAMRDRYVKKYGQPGGGDEELGIAVHFKLPEDSEPKIFRVSYLLGDYDEERGGLLKHFEMGATYYNACIKNGDYGNVNAMLGGKTDDDAIRLASEYTKIYETLRDCMDKPKEKTVTEQTATVSELLPDPTVSIAEMNIYGYSWDGMLPLTRERATALFDANKEIYLLYPDATEGAVFEREEIESFSGIFGIERTEWVKTPEFAAMKATTENYAGKREADLLYGSGDRFGIYQIKGGEEMRDYLFEAHARLKDRGLSVNRGNYELVYTMGISDLFSPITDKNDFLHQVYEIFNISRPKDYTGRSVSVSDVIVLKYNGEISSHYVDSCGFRELPAFLGEETQKSQAAEATVQTYSQVGNTPKEERAAISKDERPPVPKPKLTLIERLEANKRKAAVQGQADAPKHDKNREV